MKKSIVKKFVVVLIGVMCLSMVGCSEGNSTRKSKKKHHKDSSVESTIVIDENKPDEIRPDEEPAVTTKRKNQDELSFELQGINEIRISDNETSDNIYINFDSQRLAVNGEFYDLTDEENAEILSYMTDYSISVKAKDDEYWPHTEEYPDMFILFTYKVNSQRWDGALCYPDDWTDMIDYLKSFAD